jgi:hypothetical protein
VLTRFALERLLHRLSLSPYRERFLLNLPAPRLRVYPKETVIAEKCEAMESLELGNSRMKDFYDLWMLARLFPFDGETLTAAIAATFLRRDTPLPNGPPVALTKEFSGNTNKLAQWQAFSRRLRLQGTAPSLGEVTALLSTFLLPPSQALQKSAPFRALWTSAGGWKEADQEP